MRVEPEVAPGPNADAPEAGGLLTSISMAPPTAFRWHHRPHFDGTTDRRRIQKIASIIDEHTQHMCCRWSGAARSITAEGLIIEFDRQARQCDTHPRALRRSNDQSLWVRRDVAHVSVAMKKYLLVAR